MTTDVTKLTAAKTAAKTKADDALALLDEAWAYFTPEKPVASPKADDVNDDTFVFYYNAA